MKNLLVCLFFVVSGLLSAQQLEGYIYFPNNVDNPLTSLEKRKIREAYKNNTSFIYSNPIMLKNIKDLMRNRVKVFYLTPRKASGSKAYKNARLLSTVPLYDVYNKNVQYDITYNDRTFNILKYQLDFYPKKREIYKLGDYYITVLPQKRTKK